MDCPRCGTKLTRISLNGELQSVYCAQCGFADVESDHTRTSAGGETWDDALRRFRTAGAEESGEPDAGAGSDAADGANTDGNGSDGLPDDTDGAGASGSDPDHTDGETEAEEA